MQAGANGTAAASASAPQSAEASLREALGISVEVAQDLLACAAESGRAHSAEAAAWHFYNERASMLACLCFALEVFLEYRDAPAAVVQHATALLRHLVGREGTAGAPTLLASLCSIAQARAPVADHVARAARAAAALACEEHIAC